MYNSFQYNTTLYNILAFLRRVVRTVVQYASRQHDVKFEDGDPSTTHEDP